MTKEILELQKIVDDESRPAEEREAAAQHIIALTKPEGSADLDPPITADERRRYEQHLIQVASDKTWSSGPPFDLKTLTEYKRILVKMGIGSS